MYKDLRSLSRTDHAPVGVVQLTGPGQFSVAADRRVESTQVGERGRKRQSIQNLERNNSSSHTTAINGSIEE